MKKWIMSLSIMGSLLIFTACSEETSKVSDKVNNQVESSKSDDTAKDNSEKTETNTTDGTDVDSGEQLADGEVEYVQDELEDREEYNKIYSIFLDKKMVESFKKLVGDDIDIFRVTFQQITPVPTDDEKLYAFHGYLPGLEGIAEGVVVFDESGNIWAATTEGENVNLYTNSGDVKKHHPIIEDWRQTFFSGNNIVYKGE
ncbi:MAG TPA: hypothetical protein VK190_02025 [Pseudoneobacillus sp.]|nr:hypothetical protein [Pseudoneobacillus sp.]